MSDQMNISVELWLSSLKATESIYYEYVQVLEENKFLKEGLDAYRKMVWGESPDGGATHKTAKVTLDVVAWEEKYNVKRDDLI